MSAPDMPEDRRNTVIRHLGMVYDVPKFFDRETWAERAQSLKKHVLVSCGLWPSPPKTPLNARIFERIERDGYSVEKVYFESFPGFYVTGNLYRPLDRKGPFPAVLCPHGHWPEGRLADEELGSLPGRSIGFARQGYVAFSHDMIGYNDSTQLSHRYGGERENLWGISLMGLQLWNSIRALDFLSSLPDVDRNRLSCTGESGGGTQTYLLAAADDRVKVSGPVVMVSAHMQGGCLCENAPNLRIDTDNVELAAVAAPRPQILIACTQDWTKNTPHVEYPAVRDIYRLFGAEEKVGWAQMDAPHNYNKDSREAAYAWFARWLLNDPDASHHREQPFQAEKAEDLLVFAREPRPASALDEEGVTCALIEQARQQQESLRPRDRASLNRFRKAYRDAYSHTLYAASPSPESLLIQEREAADWPQAKVTRLYLGRKGEGDRVPAVLLMPKASRGRIQATLVAHPQGSRALLDAEAQKLSPLVEKLLEKGQAVLLIDAFQTGEAVAERKIETGFFTTYNRTDTANRVQDILTGMAYLKSLPRTGRAHLAGLGEAGLWCLLARSLASGTGVTVADTAAFDNNSDDAFLQKLFIPGLRRAGDFDTAGALLAPAPLILHNTGGVFRTGRIADAYRAAGAESALTVKDSVASAEEIAGWMK
ncbi:MAG: acetylxylan esterase [Armatimonadetes bacterium]|nr:acetylxylan esterase [Armatimonadota bacterium]